MLFKGGSHSSGQSLVGNISSDLCVPMGLVLPDYYDFLIDPIHAKQHDDTYSLWSTNYMNDQTLDDLFTRVCYGKNTFSSVKKTRRADTKMKTKSKAKHHTKRRLASS